METACPQAVHVPTARESAIPIAERHWPRSGDPFDFAQDRILEIAAPSLSGTNRIQGLFSRSGGSEILHKRVAGVM
jgi:hypothetical protein